MHIVVKYSDSDLLVLRSLRAPPCLLLLDVVVCTVQYSTFVEYYHNILIVSLGHGKVGLCEQLGNDARRSSRLQPFLTHSPHVNPIHMVTSSRGRYADKVYERMTLRGFLIMAIASFDVE